MARGCGGGRALAFRRSPSAAAASRRSALTSAAACAFRSSSGARRAVWVGVFCRRASPLRSFRKLRSTRRPLQRSFSVPLRSESKGGCRAGVIALFTPVPPIEPRVVRVRLRPRQQILSRPLRLDGGAVGFGLGGAFLRRHRRPPGLDAGDDFVDLGGLAPSPRFSQDARPPAGIRSSRLRRRFPARRARPASAGAMRTRFRVVFGIVRPARGGVRRRLQRAVDFGLGLVVELDAVEGVDQIGGFGVRGERVGGGGGAGDDGFDGGGGGFGGGDRRALTLPRFAAGPLPEGSRAMGEGCSRRPRSRGWRSN